MRPPEDPVAERGNAPPAVSSCPRPAIRKLTRRAQFLAAARARKQGVAGMLVQMRDRRDGDPAIGLGFTCSKKVGNAVMRNRAKRRLRAVARDILPVLGRPGHDYVLIGKPVETVSRPYEALLSDLRHAIEKLHGPS
ncbi:MAG: ribonuclease P protein component [Roseivivax sp.]|nr:ribonuclease P protein component [Roseivivax sp.]